MKYRLYDTSNFTLEHEFIPEEARFEGESLREYEDRLALIRMEQHEVRMSRLEPEHNTQVQGVTASK